MSSAGISPATRCFPGVLQLEALAQTGAVAVLAQPESKGKIVLFGRADEVKFRRAVCPGRDLALGDEAHEDQGSGRQRRGQGLRRLRTRLQRYPYVRGHRAIGDALAQVTSPLGRPATITGLGAYAPETVVTNDDLAAGLDTSDEWIRQRTGIAERRIAEPGVSTSDLGLRRRP